MEPNGMDDAERDELGRFLPGWKGGPGRPKFSIVSIIRNKLETVPDGEKQTVAEMMVEKYLGDAYATGDGVAMRDLIDRFDGKPKQSIETHNANEAAWIDLARELLNEADSESEAEAGGEIHPEAPAETDDT